MNAISVTKTIKSGLLVLAASTLFGAALFYSRPTPALTVFCSNCSNWWTQALEKLELINTQINTARQLQDSLQQAISLPGRMFQNVTSNLQRVVGVYQNARMLGRDVQNFDERFMRQFSGYENYLRTIGNGTVDMGGRYRQWSDYGMENIRAAMKSAGFNVESISSDNDMLDTMLSRSSSASGRLQALQAGNEIAALNVQQLTRLRDMFSSQITLQANYMATQTERQAMDDALAEEMRRSRIRNSKDTGF